MADKKADNLWSKIKNASPEAKYATAVGITEFGSSLAEMMATRNQSLAAQQIYAGNARQAILQGQNQNKYLNEELAQQVWNLYDDQRALIGQQMAAMGASGFTDVSAGDRRIIRDTKRKTEEAVSGLNRSAYLQSFENERQAMFEASRLNYIADMSRIQAKYATHPLRVATTVGKNALSALGAYASFGGFGSTAAARNVSIEG